MSYSFSGSGATSVVAYVSTQTEVSDTLGGEVDGDAPVLVFEDGGNQQAYIIEGSLEEMLAMTERARDAVLHAMQERNNDA